MEMDYPKTRMDNFFAKAAGSELADNSMEPITDREYWINEMAAKIAEGGGGGGGGFFFTPLENDGHGGLYPHATVNEIRAAMEDGKIAIVTTITEDEHGKNYSFDIVSFAGYNTDYSQYELFCPNSGTAYATSDPDSWIS